jgi:hypothetical protein
VPQSQTVLPPNWAHRIFAVQGGVEARPSAIGGPSRGVTSDGMCATPVRQSPRAGCRGGCRPWHPWSSCIACKRAPGWRGRGRRRAPPAERGQRCQLARRTTSRSGPSERTRSCAVPASLAVPSRSRSWLDCPLVVRAVTPKNPLRKISVAEGGVVWSRSAIAIGSWVSVALHASIRGGEIVPGR